MEENKKQKLNFNVPLLSTRRPVSGAITDQTKTNDTSNMVPFSWERIPGEPKDKKTCNIDIPPPPKPPPSRWAPPLTDEAIAIDHCCNPCDRCDDLDDGDDEDVDQECGHNERFTDIIDIFSLAESVDDDTDGMGCRATKGRISEANGYHSPNFIIQRFLPDAQALAEASVLNNKLPLSDSPYFNPSFSSIRRSFDSPKGCGLGSFFTWRLKAKPCSDKSPVCDAIIGGNYKQKG